MLTKTVEEQRMPARDGRQGAAYNPITHFILMPIFLGSLILAIYLTLTHRADNPVLYPWMIVISVALILLNAQSRIYALRVQDRVIRLEERLRLSPCCRAKISLRRWP